MMPTALRLILGILTDILLFGGLGYVILNIIKHPKEWFFWRNPEDLDEEEENK